MTTIAFKELNIKPKTETLTGEKIKISKVLNRPITVYAFRLAASKFEKGNGKCLYLQIQLGNETRVVFTGSSTLIDQIQQVPSDKFPFTTTIIEENERFQFT